MDGANALLSLPLGTLVPLAAGYVSYRSAYVGRDAHHKQMDILLCVVVFAAIAKAMAALAAHSVGPEIALGVGALLAYSSALIWRRKLSVWYASILSGAGIVDHDGQPSAWKTVLASQLKGPTRLVVYLKDGSRLACMQLSDFNKSPTKSCVLGEDGSVGLYVTHAYDPKKADWVENTAYDPSRDDWGYELTIVPSSEIARVEVTRPN